MLTKGSDSKVVLLIFNILVGEYPTPSLAIAPIIAIK